MITYGGYSLAVTLLMLMCVFLPGSNKEKFVSLIVFIVSLICTLIIIVQYKAGNVPIQIV